MSFGDDDDRWFAARRGIIGQLADSAGDEDADVGLASCCAQAGGAHRVSKPAIDVLIGRRHGQRKHRCRRPQAAHVPVEQERLAAVGPQRFVDTLAVQESVIEHRNDGVFLIEDAAVDVHHRLHVSERTITIKYRSTTSFGPLTVRCSTGSRRSDKIPPVLSVLRGGGLASQPDASPHVCTNAGGRSAHDRRDRDSLAGVDGERRTSGRGRDRGGPQRPAGTARCRALWTRQQRRRRVCRRANADAARGRCLGVPHRPCG